MTAEELELNQWYKDRFGAVFNAYKIDEYILYCNYWIENGRVLTNIDIPRPLTFNKAWERYTALTDKQLEEIEAAIL